MELKKAVAVTINLSILQHVTTEKSRNNAPDSWLVPWLFRRSNFGLVVLLHYVLTQAGEDTEETGQAGSSAQCTSRGSREALLHGACIVAGCKGISSSLHFALVKWAHFPLTRGEGSDFSGSMGTGISLPMLSALQQFPAALLTCLPGSAPSLPHGTSWALWMPALQLQGQGQSLSALKSKCGSAAGGRGKNWRNWGRKEHAAE